MSVFGKLLEMISVVGYEPVSRSQISKPTYTLHTAVRDLCNMAKHEAKNQRVANPSKAADIQEVHILADDADVSYWDFLRLRNYLSEITELIDAEVSLIVGRQTHFPAWEHDTARTKDEVLSLLTSLNNKYPNFSAPPNAVARPQAKDMVGKGKIESAIANTLAVLVGNGMQYGDILDKISEKLLDNEELLIELDKQVENKKCDKQIYDKKTLVPRTLVQAYLKYKNSAELGTDRAPSLTKFLQIMSTTNNFSGNSDETLIKRLNGS